MPAEPLLTAPADTDNKDAHELSSSSQFLHEFTQQSEFIPLDASPFTQPQQDFSHIEEYAYPVPSQTPKMALPLEPTNTTSSPEHSVHLPASFVYESLSQSPMNNSCQPSSSCYTSHTNSSPEVNSSSQTSSCHSHHTNNSPHISSSPLSSSSPSPLSNNSPEVVSSPQSSSPQLSPRLIPCPPLTPLPAVQNSTSLTLNIPLAQLSSPRLPTPHIQPRYLETPQPTPLLPSSITPTTLDPLQPCTAT